MNAEIERLNKLMNLIKSSKNKHNQEAWTMFFELQTQRNALQKGPLGTKRRANPCGWGRE